MLFRSLEPTPPPALPMTIEQIFTRPRHGDMPQQHARVRAVAGMGIEGDRYFGARQTPGQNISFIEAEEIEAFFAETGRVPDAGASGRNILTRGVRLHELVRREFRIGAARFRGIELCEPCSGFGRALASADTSVAAVVKRMLHRAGLRAEVLEGGEIGRGDALLPIP